MEEQMIFETDSYLPDVEAVMLDMVRADPEEPSGLISRQHLETGGKRLRARLALAATQSLGGDPGKSVAWAAACELLHNATLVHDDLQDGSGAGIARGGGRRTPTLDEMGPAWTHPFEGGCRAAS